MVLLVLTLVREYYTKLKYTRHPLLGLADTFSFFLSRCKGYSFRRWHAVNHSRYLLFCYGTSSIVSVKRARVVIMYRELHQDVPELARLGPIVLRADYVVGQERIGCALVCLDRPDAAGSGCLESGVRRHSGRTGHRLRHRARGAAPALRPVAGAGVGPLKAPDRLDRPPWGR